MKTYTLSFAAASDHVPQHAERTARKTVTASFHSASFGDVTFKVWPNRASLAKTIRMQQKREHRSDDWQPCVKLDVTEGY